MNIPVGKDIHMLNKCFKHEVDTFHMNRFHVNIQGGENQFHWFICFVLVQTIKGLVFEYLFFSVCYINLPEYILKYSVELASGGSHIY